MKKITGSKRLFLSSEKIRDLQPGLLRQAAGGGCADTAILPCIRTAQLCGISHDTYTQNPTASATC